MSETPPKPKPGSLRDRIAAFENANKGAAPAPGPAPRPKPSTLQSWKPKVPSPPQSPESERKTPGMSASDAMESIGKGGSLKERMAALQGKGAFGGGTPPPILPKPTDKPKWKPPPPISPPADEVVPSGGAIEDQGSPPRAAGDPDHDPANLEGEHEAQDGAAEIEQDPEEEERQRRAAIAARMARLGGARVGMGPPLFAKPAPKKPATPPPQPKNEEEVVSPDSASEVTTPPAEAIRPPTAVKEEAQTDSDYFPDPTRKDSDSSSLSLADSPSNAATTRSMPVPAGPRRAAPPRKKAYKSPPASQLPDVPVPDAAPEVTEEALDAEPTEEPTAQPMTEPEPEARPSIVTVTSQEHVESPEQDPVPSSEQILVIGDVQREIGEVGVSVELDTSEVGPADKLEEEDDHVYHGEPEPEQDEQEQEQEVQEQEEHEVHEQEEEDEAEEEARRQRVAAKLSQMGAFNPLAGPPPVPRRDSIPSPTARHDSPAPPVPIEEPLDVEDEVNVDLEEVGESIPSPPAAHISPQSHVEEKPVQAQEAREADEPASRADEFDDESQPDLGATRRVLYHDEMDEQERYEDRVLNEPEAWESASQPHTLHDAPLSPPRPIPQDDDPGQGDPNQSGTSAQDEEAALTDAVDSAPSDKAHEILEPELTPDQYQDDDEMAPARITRPVPPPPVNLSSKPLTAPLSPPPPPPRLPYALQADEERPESPAPRPVPPPVKSVKTAEEPPAPPPRVARRTSASIKSVDIKEEPPAPPPRVPRRTSASVKSVDILEEPPATPPRIARRTSASVKSMDIEAPPTPPPVPTSPRPSLRRPTSPPIITALPLVVPVEEDTEQEFLDAETPSQPQRVQEPEEGDEESVRRRTIAERMARLGGIQFGAPPVPTPLTRPTFPRAPPPTSIPPDEPDVDAKEPEERDETEEDEAARKQRIAAKLAGMGGMRFGMMPLSVGVAPVTARRLAPKQDDSENEDAALPVPAPAPPARRPPPPVDIDPEQEYSQTTSDDGVRVEMEESEIEEVYYSDEDVRESVEVGVPPLPPPRRPSLALRSVEVLPTPPPRSPPPIGRPPIPSIPTSLLNRRSSVATGSVPSSRISSVDYSSAAETPVQKQRIHSSLPLERATSSESGTQSEYVMVESELDAEEEPPAPPQRRSSRVPPRSVPLPPPPPPSAIDPPEQIASSAQWELPSIPQAISEFDDEGDQASSAFSEDSTFHESTSTPTRKSESRRTSGQAARPVDQQLSADDLMSLWGKVGVQVVESATGLFEKSKRSLVGDGSYAGFVKAVLAQVPDALRVSGEGEDWGYLIYVQTAASVQRRVADILPGDVIVILDAKFKGYKGLHTYSQTVGAGENGPLVGVVSEVESKKSKVRVWQANQHVGQQTVENVSYRLEDLKSGVVKVFRVMEA
ncbi:hypothetical protein DEU56DRAFT_786765 [Suillus clintonianus]|uniref:uncharacterized protein n=1 Tax=Suillus clintonianus TaxID=1904413 RepID=UPI001B86F20C|nr:uncharacterized protein DEU56DRAFT_786765 [Suillus clintonianus]KAG2146837.1 hypothetical protein DEU56DRAFT_786765 [Suillus clintonianus]